MNALDAAEELMAVGRRLQSLYQRLQQPVASLAAFGAWDALAVDPVARLSALLAPHTGSAPAPAPAVPERVVPPYRWQTEPVRAHAASQPGTVRPGEPDEEALPDRTPQPAETARFLARGSSLVPAASSGERRAPEPRDPDGVRLTRNPSSLMSILQSNISHSAQADAAPPASSAVGTASTPQGTQAQLGAVTQSGGPPASSVNRPDEGAAPQAPQGEDSQAALPWAWAGGGAAGQTHVAPALVGGGEDDPVTLEGFGGYAEGGSAGDEVLFADFAPFGRTRTEAGFDPLHAATTGPGSSLRAEPWPAPPADGDAARWQEPVRPAQTLSTEQIDQILDALDERLELMLLRMYGTSTL